MIAKHCPAAWALMLTAALELSACGTGPPARPPSSARAAADPHTVSITITSGGCAPTASTYASGALTFTITNKDATAVSELELLSGERIVGEKENLPPGLSGSFAISLDPGEYVVYCPGATSERNTIRVTGTASTSGSDTGAVLTQAAAAYGRYVTSQVAELLTRTQALDAALKGTDLRAAQTAYKMARAYYERIEPVAESFTTSAEDNLDSDIDARAGDVPADQWTGFHRIEKGLFQDASLSGLATCGDGLVTDVQKLQTLTTGLKFQPAELANGSVELLDEVSKTKITGEEERYSHIDLLDFAANVEGSEQAFAALQPALSTIDPALADEVATAFAALDALLDQYRSATDASGYVLYPGITDADRTALAQALQAVAEPLSRVAGKVVNG